MKRAVPIRAEPMAGWQVVGGPSSILHIGGALANDVSCLGRKAQTCLRPLLCIHISRVEGACRVPLVKIVMTSSHHHNEHDNMHQNINENG